MDRSLVQAKQSRSCTGTLERIAATVANTTTHSCVGWFVSSAIVEGFVTCGAGSDLRWAGEAIAGPIAVPLPLVRIREHRSAADTARGRRLITPPAAHASATNDTNRSVNT